jgi:hypothetical protein
MMRAISSGRTVPVKGLKRDIMMIQEKMEFIRFLEKSFENDINIRELRLSDDELRYLKELMPRADVREMPDADCSDGKRWYEVMWGPGLPPSSFTRQDPHAV